MQIRNVPTDEVHQKVQEFLSWRWQARDVGTLIECVNENVSWLSCRDIEHLMKTIHKDANAGLSRALSVCRINTGNYLATRIQVDRKLNEKGGEKIANVLLFFFVSKVKEEIC